VVREEQSSGYIFQRDTQITLGLTKVHADLSFLRVCGFYVNKLRTRGDFGTSLTNCRICRLRKWLLHLVSSVPDGNAIRRLLANVKLPRVQQGNSLFQCYSIWQNKSEVLEM
jgi:hypothetical protein